MKKTIITTLFSCIFIFVSTHFAAAFEIYGYWKSDLKYPLNIIKFDKTTYYYGTMKLPVKFLEKNGEYIVLFNVDSEIQIVPEGNNIIKVTYPTPELQQNIKFTRISEDEAVKIMQNR